MKPCNRFNKHVSAFWAAKAAVIKAGLDICVHSEPGPFPVPFHFPALPPQHATTLWFRSRSNSRSFSLLFSVVLSRFLSPLLAIHLRTFQAASRLKLTFLSIVDSQGRLKLFATCSRVEDSKMFNISRFQDVKDFNISRFHGFQNCKDFNISIIQCFQYLQYFNIS